MKEINQSVQKSSFQQRKKSIAGNSIQNNYQHFRSLRKDYSELKEIKPKLGDSWSSKNSGLYLFENPIFENYISGYIEETQNDLTGSIDFEKFK